MNKFKQLANQTLWYGLSAILARFLNYLLTPLYTNYFAEKGNGQIATIYASITFLNILFTFGLETYFFRFAKQDNSTKIFNLCFSTLLIYNFIGISLFLIFQHPLSLLLNFPNPTFYTYTLLIVLIDALTAIPFAILRFQNKAPQYAFIRISSILLNIFLNLFFIVLCPMILQKHPYSFIQYIYNPHATIQYVLIANLISSAFTLLLLSPTLKNFSWQWNPQDFKNIFLYTFPLVIIGFGGMINETIDRIMLPYLFQGSTDTKYIQNGIYAANYKLSILITLFVQAFRMGAEPFFFKHAQEKDSPQMYARIMTYFLIACCIGFLSVMLYLPIWKYFISAHKYQGFAQGLKVVPILLCANIFLGMYYNVSIWYKITNKNTIGALISIFGALITLLINYFFIPQYGYMACAWATFICYLFMLIIGYAYGQKYFPIPYQIKKISAYFFFAITLGCTHYFLFFSTSFIFAMSIGSIFFALFLFVVWKFEKKDLLPLFTKKSP